MQRFQVTELATGERVISEQVSSVRSVAIGFWIGTGSRDETPERAGVSHFVEHLLFKGSSRYDAIEIAETFDELGGELNAATSREHTVLYSRVPDHHLERALDVMADMVYAPRLDDVDSEREVVLEEIAMVDDTPQDLVHDMLAEAVFPQHPLGRPVIGTADVISTVSRRALAGFHRAAYAPPKLVLSAAGNLRHERLVELLERARAEHATRPAARALTRKLVTAPPPPTLRFQRKDTEQYHVCLGAPGLARNDPRRFAASLLDAVLGGAASSRLFQEIREKRGMAYAVYSFASQYTDTGQIGLYVGTREENLAECLRIALEQIAELAAGRLRERELERAKESLKGRIMLSLESTSNRMTRLGKALVTGTELLSVERVVKHVDAVRASDLAELAAELLAPQRVSAAGIGPDEERFLAAVEHVNPELSAAA
jgi:predicted Zn-dependent peptidase